MRTALTVSSRAYSMMLVLYPDELRSRFADEMTGVFDQQIEDAWEESGFKGLARVWLYALGDLLLIALPMQLGQPIVVVPTLSLISNSFLFLILFRALSPLAALFQANRNLP